VTDIFAFECWIPNAPWGDVREVVNERSLGRAKAQYWHRVRDAWPEMPFTAVRGRKVGAPRSSPEFLLGVQYRGIPGLALWQQDRVGKYPRGHRGLRRRRRVA
jgi:hypothetical protein